MMRLGRVFTLKSEATQGPQMIEGADTLCVIGGKGLYRDVEQWVKTCEECQKRATIRVTEELHTTLENSLWLRVGLDVVYMPMDKGVFEDCGHAKIPIWMG